MLKRLRIKNYAIIDDLSIDFCNGYTVFTGETGAGKSIIVGALLCLKGGRADTSFVKTGEQKAVIEGVFETNNKIKKILDEKDIETEDDQIIIRRTITKEGKSSIHINDNSVTLSFLNELFSDDIDIHSQKENAYLLNSKRHLSLLDAYADDKEEYSDYLKAYECYFKRKKALEKFLNKDNNINDLDYYKFSLNEIESANLSIEEEIELQEKERKFKNLQKNMQSYQEIISLYENDHGLKELLFDLKRAVGDNEDLHDVFEKINDIYYGLEEEMINIKSYYESYEISEEEINHIEERLYVINKLKRKYKLDIEGILNYKIELEEKITQFENRESYIINEEKEIAKLKKIASDLASKLSIHRKKKAIVLENEVINELNDLLLNNVQFKVSFNNKELSNNGVDDVEFLISLNKGEDLKPLAKVASGGEISRVMLGLKVIFTRLNNTSLVVFDEIDNGVSGQVAFTVGKKMHEISSYCQVLTITHLAPVAAFASKHLFIYKNDDSGKTSTHIRELDDNERINELAMISSSMVNSQTKAAALELRERAKQCK